MQFSKEDKFLRAWGKRGKGPGDFNLPHAIFYDTKTNQVFVCDRSNKRVQIFDAQGKFVTQWNNIGTPYGLFVHKGEHVFLSDGAGNAVRKLDFKGMTLARWGSKKKKRASSRMLTASASIRVERSTWPKEPANAFKNSSQ